MDRQEELRQWLEKGRLSMNSIVYFEIQSSCLERASAFYKVKQISLLVLSKILDEIQILSLY
jgi:hypothetical protein